MWPFWWTVIEPLLRSFGARITAEIGSEGGKNLANLIRFAAAVDGRTHAIDPKPLFDTVQWTERARGRLVVHRNTSLNVLPALEALDAILIDGDHNWYTVTHELRAIRERQASLGAPFPLVFLHDVGWPWGRRDLYYDPASIPAECRQPYVANDPASLAGPGKTPAHLEFFRATTEGGPRNGVLTAVEDFVSASSEPIDLVIIPGFSGLGVLAPRAARSAHPSFDRLLTDLTPTPGLSAYIEFLEAGRLRRPIRIQSSTAEASADQYPG
jgi:hypothetical protein